ncbi:MAG: sigma 54-interacting transcriptional regulator, partial [Syntrophomonadaceae bacterium]|nr:sigma 54-interacting transcriptional regulator [Syntrophomonadaceae bacterium]
VKLAVSSTPLMGKKGKTLGTVVILQPMKKYKQLIERVSGTRANITFEQIIGRSHEFKYALWCAEKAANSDSNVLLMGESGVGKDMFAQGIHNASGRSNEPFFAINCAALPRELISSELLGYEDGAFTGARKGGNPGKFELADQGTIFLDEVGEMPLDLQSSLLRLLEEGAVIRLGGRETIPINVRIIAASNKNLLEEVKNGNFRLDLFYRLGVIDIRIPSLKERKDDIPELVDHFIKSIGPKLGKIISGIDETALELLINYEWPGNVRDLSYVIEWSINLSSKEILTADDLPMRLRKPVRIPLANMDLDANKSDFEEKFIRECLRKNNNNRVKTAKDLGINRATLYRKLAKYSIT